MPDCIACGEFTKFEKGLCYSCYNEEKTRKKQRSTKKETKREPSEGELFLQEYFESEGIRFKPEHSIIGLKNDPKSHRRADFYLPTFGLYVEFFGMWQVSEKEKERYREKKKVYKENNIPCVFLYPENLGIIDFLLPKRAIKEFKEHKLTKELWLFRLKFLWLYKKENLLLTLFLLYVLLWGNFIWEEDLNLMIGMAVILVYQMYSVVEFYKKKLS